MGSKTPFDAERGKSLLKFDPADLVIETNPKSPLFQRRGLEPPDEAMVASIMETGVIEPVLVVRGKDGRPYVAAGARRTINAREANKRLKAKRLPTKPIPAVFRDEKGDEGISLKIIENAQRLDLTLSQRAEEARLALVAGYDEEQVARWFGVTVATIENYRSLAQSHPKVQAAVDAGTVRLSDAVRVLGKLSEDEQPKALAKLQADKPTRKAKQADRAKTGSKAPVQVSPMRRLTKLRDFIAKNGGNSEFPIELTSLVDWLSGTGDERTVAEAFPSLTGFAPHTKAA